MPKSYSKYFLLAISLFILQFSRLNDTPIQFNYKPAYISYSLVTFSIMWYFFYLLVFKFSLPNRTINIFANFFLASFLLYTIIFEVLFIIARYPLYKDICVIEKGAYFSKVEQEQILAESHRNFRIVKRIILSPKIRISIPIYSNNSIKCN